MRSSSAVGISTSLIATCSGARSGTRKRSGLLSEAACARAELSLRADLRVVRAGVADRIAGTVLRKGGRRRVRVDRVRDVLRLVRAPVRVRRVLRRFVAREEGVLVRRDRMAHVLERIRAWRTLRAAGVE